MSHTRPTKSDFNQNTLVNQYAFFLTKGQARMIRDMDFRLYSLEIEPEDYIQTCTKLAYEHNGFAQVYKEWCRNFRDRKDLYWMYEVELEFNDYQYLGKRIIKEIEFAFLYCTKYRSKKSVKKLINVLQEYIGNHKKCN
jgi:hypothetical protein